MLLTVRKPLTGRHVDLLKILSVLTLLTAYASVSYAQAQEKRLQRNAAAPQWLDAVGKLAVPTIKYEEGRRRHHREDCSATLIANRAGKYADSIVTAWHCLEAYSDLSKPIIFTLEPWGREPVALTARRLADGGHIDADWAILRLQRAIPSSEVRGLALGRSVPPDHTVLQMAGYSGDSGLGRHGAQLTYDPSCRATTTTKRFISTDCLAYKGASGGAVVSVDESGQTVLRGIISQGDSDQLSIYIPTTRFAGEISHLLALRSSSVRMSPSSP
ncbi:MAG: serine protease [Halioglobus sp.]